MASEYLKWKARDEKPAPPPRERTKKEKLLNWLHYNKLWLIIGAVLLWIVGSMLWNVLGIGQVKPDVIVAYVGRDPIPEESASAFETALAPLAEDRNGDGSVVVELRQYAVNRSGDPASVVYYNYAANTELMADITQAESYLFLAEDPEGVQLAYQIFSRDDGSPPEDEDYEAMDKVYRWGDCPALAALELDAAPFENLYLGRRCFYSEREAEVQRGNELLWERMIEGATR